MTLLSSYLLRSFFRVFFLSVCSFIGVLLVTRLKEIARFTALGSDFSSLMQFIVYQIPHILPIAIPISCLISSIILFQKMSRTRELTAFRASGISLKILTAPIILSGIFLSIVTFYIASEVTTSSRQKVREMLFEETSVNPLILLQRQKLLKIKESFIDMDLKSGEKVGKNVLFISYNRSNGHLSLMSADAFRIKKDLLLGENVSVISHIGDEEGFDTLLLENQEKMSTKAAALSNVMKKSRFRLNPSSLPMRYVMARARYKNEDFSYTLNEILRRFSLGLSAFTFTFIGMAYGMEISRVESKKGIFFAFLLAIFIFASYMLGKSIKTQVILGTSVFIIPHIFSFLIGYRRMLHVSRGIE